MTSPFEFFRTILSPRFRLGRSLLRISLVEDILPKSRFGEPHDGGYILVDETRRLAGLLSFGVGETILFEEELHRAWSLPLVWLADPTVERPPVLADGFHFFPLGLKGASARKGLSLQGWVEKLPSRAPRSWILKIDVEGDEWAALDEAPDRALEPFRQIVIEFHHWHRHWDQVRRVYEKLARQFVMVHGHANNYGGVIRVGSLHLAEVLELTWVARDQLDSLKIDTPVMNQPLDAPNDPARPELTPNFWPFAGQ
jgi:hypothetical protein